MSEMQSSGKVDSLKTVRFMVAFLLILSCGTNVAAQSASQDPRVRPWNDYGWLILELGKRYSFHKNPYKVDPTSSLIVIVGDAPENHLSADLFNSFLKAGGRALLASDSDSMNEFFGEIDVDLWPSVISIRKDNPQGLKGVDGFRDCPIIPVPESQKHPVFAGVKSLAFNRPAFFGLRAKGTLLRAPAGCNYPRSPLVTSYQRNQARVISIADHSLFINSMLSKEDNVVFFKNTLKWLDSDQTITQVLVYCDGTLQTAPINARPSLDSLATKELINYILGKMERNQIWNEKLSDLAQEYFWQFWFATGPSLILSALVFSATIIYVLRRRNTPSQLGLTSGKGLPGIVAMRKVLSADWKKVPVSVVDTLDIGFREFLRQHSFAIEPGSDKVTGNLPVDTKEEIRRLLKSARKWKASDSSVKLKHFKQHQLQMVNVCKRLSARHSQ